MLGAGSYERVLDSYYTNQAITGSGAGTYYKGRIFSRGHGINSILSSVFKLAKPLLKKTGRYIAKKGVRGLSDIASDIIEGSTPRQAIKRRAGLAFEDIKKEFRNSINRSVTPSAYRPRKKGGRKVVKKRRRDNLGTF